MLTIVFSQTSQSTTVIKTDTASQFVRANQTDICVMNFTLSTQNDIRICGITPTIGQFLENSSQEDDWGFYSPQIICYDSNQDGGDYNWSMDCIWISNASFPHEYYDSSDTVLNGTAPPEGTNPTTSPGCFRGCKAPAWRHVKSYDTLDGGNWSQDADSIIYEGADINNAFNDQLNAVTFKINSSSNATQADISSFSLWCESGDHLGFQSNEDIRLQTVLYSSETSSWNVTALDSDINTQATFYATVNISATASHDKSLRFWIPTKIDSETTGQYNDGDQGMFLAGCNDTGNLLNTNYLITDIYPPLTNANPITEYWETGSSVNISAQATDNGSGTSSVSLYYRYRSSNGSSWSVPVLDSTDSNPTDGFSFHFVFPLNGHYGFFTRGADNISNIEASRTTNDTTCAYDSTAPISSVDTCAPYWKTTTPQTISYTASDNGTGSGLYYCQLYYRYSVNNASWGSWMIGGNDSDPWMTKQWSFSFANGSGFYQFYARASDNVSNLEAAPAGYDAICGYDATPPLSSVAAISSFWRKTSPLTITATASDSTSNVKNVTLYYRFSTNNASWGGWRSFGVDTASPWSWSFTFSNGSGHYQFYSIAKDYATNAEATTGTADTVCGYDTVTPTCSIAYNKSATYLKSGTALKIYVNFTELLSGINESFIKINISTAGDGDLYNTTLSRINNTHWYKDWIIPAGSDDDGIFTVKIYARDNISNNLASYPTTSGIKKIDNTNPICSMSFNQSKTYFEEGDVLRIYGNFTESGAGMDIGSVTIRIDTAAGSGNLSNTSMIEIDITHYYYDWSIPPGSENDGSFMVKIYAQDNLTNLLTSYPTTNTTKMIDNTPPVASIEYNTTRTYFNYYPALKIYANFTEEGSGVDLSSMYLLLSTPDMTINTSMTALDDLHYYYNWTIPESTNDGVLTAQLFAQDNAGNILSSYPTRDESKNIDTTAPLISSISSNQITSTSATITWGTNENATTCVQYGTTISYGNWSNSSEPTTSHSQTLEGLLKASLYHYQVQSTDSAGNTATSPDNTYTTKFGGGGVYHGGGATPLKPIANAGGPYEGYVNSTIIFSGSLSRDTHGTIVGYRWDWNNDGFYDTNWSVSATTTHIFTVLGNYSVRLQVKDNDGLTGTIVTTVTVRTAEIQNRAPIATTNGPYNDLMYQDINFNASGSFSNDSSIINYTWDFGDGYYGYGMFVIHRYNSSGVFPVSLTITDNHNIQGVTTTTATILPDLNRDNVSDIMERIIGINITPSDIQLLSVTNMTYDLVDVNDDGFFELMFNPETNIITTLGYQEGNILLDTNGDGQWNYLYDPVQNMLIPYSDMHRVDEMPILILLFLTGILMVVAIIIGMKKRYRP